MDLELSAKQVIVAGASGGIDVTIAESFLIAEDGRLNRWETK